MAIVDPVTDVRRKMLTSDAELLSPTVASDFDAGLDSVLRRGTSERITEPLTDTEPTLDDGADGLLDEDEDESEGAIDR